MSVLWTYRDWDFDQKLKTELCEASRRLVIQIICILCKLMPGHKTSMFTSNMMGAYIWYIFDIWYVYLSVHDHDHHLKLHEVLAGSMFDLGI